jgi:acyl dehydratase
MSLPLTPSPHAEPSTQRHLEDFEVGQVFHGGSIVVELEAIKRFAQEFDPQPFHLDEDLAVESLFGALAASGWHTAAMTMRMLVDGELALARGVIGAGGEISWPRPTRPGDTLRIESEILEITPSRSKPDRGMVKVRTRTLNQKDEVVQDLTANLIAWRRPAG